MGLQRWRSPLRLKLRGNTVSCASAILGRQRVGVVAQRRSKVGTMTTATLSPKSARVQFRLAGGAQPLILLPVRVNGEGPFQFILDTGAGISLLSSDLAKQLKVEIISTQEGQSAGGKVSVSLAKVDSLALGAAKIEEVDVGIVDLSHIGKTIGA